MTTLGAHLLHEMVHWRILCRASDNEQEWDQVIPHVLDGLDEPTTVDWIDDYLYDEYHDKNIDPSDGYGPIHAWDLVINDVGDSFPNADNYRWYAVSKYWMYRCNKHFGQQTDEEHEDRMVPAGANGQVPYPGEPDHHD